MFNEPGQVFFVGSVKRLEERIVDQEEPRAVAQRRARRKLGL